MKALVVGGGIGGLATALCLHAQGMECELFEQSDAIRELGVGMNTLPHAVRELAGLGLLERLDTCAVRTEELLYLNRFGQEIWREPRGLAAGYDIPQFSIHRGRLQGVLLEAVRERLGETAVRTGHRLGGFEDAGDHVVARLVSPSGASLGEAQGDILVGADGIHSTVRAALFPDEGPPTWNGMMLWRGAVPWEPFLSGRSMIIAGGMAGKLVIYPIAPGFGAPGRPLTNWAVMVRISDGQSPPPRREDWAREGRRDELMPHVQRFSLPWLDPVQLVLSTRAFYEYPCCDRDPLPRWSHGRVTLLGDAAHPMYPVGSNGASQAILDARCLAARLADTADPTEALGAYEAERLPATAEIVRQNRAGGPERVIDIVEELAPDGFERIDDVATHDQLEGIVRGYAQLAGFSQQQVNR